MERTDRAASLRHVRLVTPRISRRRHRECARPRRPPRPRHPRAGRRCRRRVRHPPPPLVRAHPRHRLRPRRRAVRRRPRRDRRPRAHGFQATHGPDRRPPSGPATPTTRRPASPRATAGCAPWPRPTPSPAPAAPATPASPPTSSRGLDHLDATVYNPATTRYGNWWEWQIGSPRLLLDTVAAPRRRTSTAPATSCAAAACAAVDHFVPDAMLGDYTGTSTGANRVDLCRVGRPARHPRPRPRQDRARPRRPLAGLPVRHQGRRPLRRRLLRPAHLGRLLRHLRLGPARRPRPAVRPARPARLGRSPTRHRQIVLDSVERRLRARCSTTA